MALEAELSCHLAELKSRDLLRSLPELPEGVLDLASNDYLGLATHPAVREAAANAAMQYGAGARAARLVSGHLTPHAQLEEALAQWKGTEAALVFPTGYAANTGTISALATAQTFICCHKRNHASLIDGCRLAQTNGARVRYFDDLGKLRALLTKEGAGYKRRLIVADAVFSMDGDVWDVPGALHLAQEWEATLLLDDAHGTGTLGQGGLGTLEYFGLPHQHHSVVLLGTLSKALGSQGGFVAASRTVVQFLMNAARPFIYTTALAPPAAAAAAAAIEIVRTEPQRVERLRANTLWLHRTLCDRGYKAILQPSPIVPVIIGEAGEAVRQSLVLRDRGLWCPAIRPPTVPAGTARLRLTACSEWSNETRQRIAAALSS